jgi:sulfonate transport system permease protein
MTDLVRDTADAVSASHSPTPSGQRLIREARGYDKDPVGHQRRRRIVYTILGIAVPVGLLAFWQIAASNGTINPKFYPSPTDNLRQLQQMFEDRGFATDLRLTLKRQLWGWFWGCLFGVLFAYILGMVRIARAALEPTLNALYTVPKITLLTPFLIIFGFKDTPVIIVIATTVFFFAWVPTQASVMSVSESYREAATSFGANRWQMFRHVIWPATLPGLFVTLRVAVSVSVLSVIGIEFAYAPQSRGLGHVINTARQTFEPKIAYAGIFVAAVLGVVFQAIVKRIGRLVVRWEKEDRGAPVV